MTILAITYLAGLGFAVYLHCDDPFIARTRSVKGLELWLEPLLKSLLWPLHFLVFVCWLGLEGLKAVMD